jgi:Xaa-Pro aminopeptidase
MSVDAEKTDRLDAYLADNGLEAAWFARPSNFAWLTGGDNVVDREGSEGVAAAGYDGEQVTVVTNTIEAPRLGDEELDGTDIESFPWYERSLADAVAERSPTPAAADFDVPGAERVTAASLRMPLTEPDIERYRALGTETAATVEEVCRGLDTDDTEREVASRLRGALSARGIESPVVLVGGEERAQAYRHYTPTDARLGGYALVSVTTQRDGLHASMTRTVAFDPPAWLDDRHEAAMTVETAALTATKRLAGEGAASDVFEDIQDAYATTGHPDEWQKHHQGGAAGFAGREWMATPTGTEGVVTPMAYAWNPTVMGAKSEDTVLVTEDGFETLTATGEWPSREIDGDGGTLVRHEIGP